MHEEIVVVQHMIITNMMNFETAIDSVFNLLSSIAHKMLNLFIYLFLLKVYSAEYITLVLNSVSFIDYKRGINAFYSRSIAQPIF